MMLKRLEKTPLLRGRYIYSNHVSFCLQEPLEGAKSRNSVDMSMLYSSLREDGAGRSVRSTFFVDDADEAGEDATTKR